MLAFKIGDYGHLALCAVSFVWQNPDHAGAHLFNIMLLALMLIAAPKPLNILFIGNSLLMNNDVPVMVTNMLNTDGSGRKVTYNSFFVSHLEDVQPGDAPDKEINSGKYDVVVLQSAMVSSSLTRTYSQARGIAMARAAKAKGARVLLYVEWPRRNINETNYTLNVYRGIAQAADTEIIPVCYAWNSVVAKSNGISLWNPDGNHATMEGSYLAACCTYFHIAGTLRNPKWIPEDVDPAFAKLCVSEAKMLETRVLAKNGRV